MLPRPRTPLNLVLTVREREQYLQDDSYYTWLSRASTIGGLLHLYWFAYKESELRSL